MEEERLREVLTRLDPEGRSALRNVLLADHDVRDHLAEKLLRLQTEQGNDLADLLDILTLNPDMRRQIVRLLGELEATRG